MQIREVEEATGLSRSNIRYYEKEELFVPERDPNNGYKEYSSENVEDIKKIAFLRTLGVSVEDIRHVIRGEIPLQTVIARQADVLDAQIREQTQARALCSQMLSREHLDYEHLDPERLAPPFASYLDLRRGILRRDMVTAFSGWGGWKIWAVLTVLAFGLALISFPFLPDQIPIQWNRFGVSSTAPRIFIFAYPAICLAARFLLRPALWQWLQNRLAIRESERFADAAANIFCLLMLIAEVVTVFWR